MSRLPKPGAPLQLADGSVLQPTVASTFKRTEILSNTAAQRLVSNTHRKLEELPATAKQLNGFAAVLTYTGIGLSDDEISVATGLTGEQIVWMRQQPAYTTLETYILSAAKQEAVSEIKAILVGGEIKAATKIVELVESDNEKISLAAARDILDRGGHKAAEQIDIRQSMMNEFRIEVVDKRERLPIIDLEID